MGVICEPEEAPKCISSGRRKEYPEVPYPEVAKLWSQSPVQPL